MEEAKRAIAECDNQMHKSNKSNDEDTMNTPPSRTIKSPNQQRRNKQTTEGPILAKPLMVIEDNATQGSQPSSATGERKSADSEMTQQTREFNKQSEYNDRFKQARFEHMLNNAGNLNPFENNPVTELLLLDDTPARKTTEQADV